MNRDLLQYFVYVSDFLRVVTYLIIAAMLLLLVLGLIGGELPSAIATAIVALINAAWIYTVSKLLTYLVLLSEQIDSMQATLHKQERILNNVDKYFEARRRAAAIKGN